MSKGYLLTCLLTLSLFVTGCGDQLYLEKASIALTMGLDLDEQDKLLVYVDYPVFSKEAKKKYKITAVKAPTIYDAVKAINSISGGKLVTGKIQNILIGKRLLQKKDVYPYLDAYYRDAKNDFNAVMIAIDGPVKEIMHTNMEDKGRPSVYIKQLVDTTYQSGICVRTTLQKFHYQTFEKGVTPFFPEMKAQNNEIIISGTTLLHKNRRYAASLNRQESQILRLLQQGMTRPIPLLLSLPVKALFSKTEKAEVTINIDKVNFDVTTNYHNGQFIFDMKVKLRVTLTEHNFAIDFDKEKDKLESLLAQQIKNQSEALVKKIQKHQIDPFGLGLYARAYQYKNWKSVENQWPQAFSRAEVIIRPIVTIQSYGVEK